ncbi:MAG: LCP family protein [Oscillospiraceae bacterium]|nr:LCP family protein [Oscillospiraceae bacterium]
MGDIYISGNGRRNQETQDIPIQPQRIPAQNVYRQQQPAQQQPPQSPQQPNQQKPTKKRKKKHSFGKLIFTLIMIAVIVGASAFGIIYSTASKIDYNSEGNKNNVYVDSASLMQDANVTNILLIGVDGSSSDTTLRSDTMLMVSIDRNNKKLKLTSFLRDTWVVIPSTGGYAKLNASYAYGGTQLLMDTIEYNFNIEIDHYMLVGFDMFKTIIDSIGGIEVEVTEKEAQFMRDTARATRNIQAGENVHMNGEQALVYCRIRKLDSDFMRTSRQRKVISALISKAKDSSLTDLKALADEVLPMVQTDISPMELTKLAMGAVKYITYDIKSERVPTDGTWSSRTINGQSAIVADFGANQEFLRNYLYSVDIPEEDTTEN